MRRIQPTEYVCMHGFCRLFVSISKNIANVRPKLYIFNAYYTYLSTQTNCKFYKMETLKRRRRRKKQIQHVVVTVKQYAIVIIHKFHSSLILLLYSISLSEKSIFECFPSCWTLDMPLFASLLVIVRRMNMKIKRGNDFPLSFAELIDSLLKFSSNTLMVIGAQGFRFTFSDYFRLRK